jgi:hypothetical protein
MNNTFVLKDTSLGNTVLGRWTNITSIRDRTTQGYTVQVILEREVSKDDREINILVAIINLDSGQRIELEDEESTTVQNGIPTRF